MAHFAWIDENNIVYAVSVVDNVNLLDTNGEEDEQVGIQYLENVHGDGYRWIQTSYNSNFRGKYAAIGDTYDVVLNEFITPIVE